MMTDKRFDGGRSQTRLLLVLSAAYLIVIAYCDLLTRGPSGLATVWPCNGLLAVGLMLLTSGRRLILLAVSLVAHLILDGAGASPLLMSALFSALDAAEAILVAMVLHKAFGGAPRLKNLGRALKTVGLAMPATAFMALVGALACAPILHLSLGSLIANWLFINGLGMAVSLPAALILFDPTIQHGFERSGREKLLCYVIVAATGLFAFGRPEHSLPFLAFPAGVLAAFRLGPKGAAWTTLLVTAIAAPLSVLGLASTVATRAQASERMHSLQLFVGALFFTCLAAALALATQQRLKRLLVHRQALARRAQARAQAASQAKTDFLATMSHEIRTPLNSVLGFTRLLAERDDLAPDARRQVGLIDGAGGALLTLVNDVLDFSRVEAGRVDLELAPTQAEAVLREAAEIVALEAQAKGLSLDVRVVGQSDLHHELDGARLRQVMLNLLNNAVKFTPAGRVSAQLTILPAEHGDVLKVEISDTGIGVPVELRDQLFERFSQGDNSVTRAFGGTGLGLAISKALIELMGGQIGMTDNPGPGSTFWFSLRARRAEPTAPTASRAWDHSESARILLVDDHPLNREIGEALLTLVGCEVITAENGYEALALVEEGGFDIVLMDIHMPGMDGLAATRAIRALHGPAAAIPIIAMSADALPQHIARCREAGMVDHVAKPIQRDVLYATVETWLQRSQAA